MNLFGNEKVKIDTNTLFSAVCGSSANYITDVEMNFTDGGHDLLDVEINEQRGPGIRDKVTIRHTFNEEGLIRLIEILSKIEETIVFNKSAKDYPSDAMNLLFKAIIENHIGISTFDKIPKPKINIYVENQKLYLSAVDFANKRILVYQEINVEYLRSFSSKNENDVIVDAICDELIYHCCIKNDDDLLHYFKYLNLSDEQEKTLKRSRKFVYHIIKEYIKHNMIVEDLRKLFNK